MKQVAFVSLLSLALMTPALADVGEKETSPGNTTEAVKPAPDGSAAVSNAPSSAQPPTSDRTPEKTTPTPLNQTDSVDGETSDRTPENHDKK